MNTVKVNVSELSGATLDWCVAKCEGYEPVYTRHYVTPSHAEDPKKICIPAPSWVQPFEPSTNWGQGGPIIERENLCLRGIEGGFHAWYHQTPPKMFGPSMLTAAMRCYVASKLGDVVEVPAELLK